MAAHAQCCVRDPVWAYTHRVCLFQELAPLLAPHLLLEGLRTSIRNTWSAHLGHISMMEAVVRAHHPDEGIIHVPNPARNGKKPHYGANCSAQTLTRRYAYRPPTDLCQAASPASTGGRAWQRCRWNTEDTTSTTPLEEKYHHTYGDVSGMSCQLQATLGTTSPGTWIEWTVVPDQVWDSTDTGVIHERDHGETEGTCAKVETVGESTDLCEGTGEGTTGWSAESHRAGIAMHQPQ